MSDASKIEFLKQTRQPFQSKAKPVEVAVVPKLNDLDLLEKRLITLLIDRLEKAA